MISRESVIFSCYTMEYTEGKQLLFYRVLIFFDAKNKCHIQENYFDKSLSNVTSKYSIAFSVFV